MFEWANIDYVFLCIRKEIKRNIYDGAGLNRLKIIIEWKASLDNCTKNNFM